MWDAGQNENVGLLIGAGKSIFPFYRPLSQSMVDSWLPIDWNLYSEMYLVPGLGLGERPLPSDLQIFCAAFSPGQRESLPWPILKCHGICVQLQPFCTYIHILLRPEGRGQQIVSSPSLKVKVLVFIGRAGKRRLGRTLMPKNPSWVGGKAKR